MSIAIFYLGRFIEYSVELIEYLVEINFSYFQQLSIFPHLPIIL